MMNRPKFLHLLGEESKAVQTTPYKATLMAYGEGGENTFEFEGPNGQGMTDTPFRYELNGAVKHGEVLTAMGSLLLKGRAFPFIAMIAPKQYHSSKD